MQNVNAATRLRPRLMSIVLMILKSLDSKKINSRLIVENEVDFRAKIVEVENGKPVPSEKINEIINEKIALKPNWGISFDGEFILIATEKTVIKKDYFAKSEDSAEETSNEEKEEKKKTVKKPKK